MTEFSRNSSGAATLRNRAAGMARITLVPTMADLTLSPEQLAILHLYDIIADLTGRLSDLEAQAKDNASPARLVFASRRVSEAVSFTSCRRAAA